MNQTNRFRESTKSIGCVEKAKRSGTAAFIRGRQPHSWKVRHYCVAGAHEPALSLQCTIYGQIAEPVDESAVAAIICGQLGDRIAPMKVAALAMNVEYVESPSEIGKRECSIAWHLASPPLRHQLHS
jgi:hypothetical protein